LTITEKYKSLNRGKGWYTTSTNEKKIEEGKYQEIKDDAEIYVEC
jgi:hypothetical protein